MKNRMAVGLIALTALAVCSASAATARRKSPKSPVAPQAVKPQRSSVASGTPSRSTRLVSVDTIRLLRESDAGKQLETEIKQEVQEFEGYFNRVKTDLVSEKQSLAKQTDILSKKAFEEKQQELAAKERDMQREIESKRDSLAMSIQRRQMNLRDEQLKVANERLAIEGWDVMVEKSAPFLLGMSDNVDVTNVVLPEVNKAFQAKTTESSNPITDAPVAA